MHVPFYAENVLNVRLNIVSFGMRITSVGLQDFEFRAILCHGGHAGEA